MAEYVLGMDPVTFTMTLFSILGLVLSIFTFAYYYSPSRQVQYLSERIDQTWQLFQSICEADSLSCNTRMRLYQYFEKLEIELASLMFLSLPYGSVMQKLRAWKKTWGLFLLSMDVQNLNIILTTVSKQRSRIIHTQELTHQDVKLYCSKLQASFDETITALTAFFEEREIDSSSEEMVPNQASKTLNATTSSPSTHQAHWYLSQQSSGETCLSQRDCSIRSKFKWDLPTKPPKSYHSGHRQLLETV